MSDDFSTSKEYLEWKEARTIIDAIDDRLNDLRKYGLSFVSALLTAQALIDSSQPLSSTYVPPGVKLAIILASLVLVCVLYTMEVTNRQIQHAASVRARYIERQSQFQGRLTREIARTFAIYHVDWTLDGLYAMMLVATGVLGYFVTGGGTFSWTSLTGISVGATIMAIAFVITVQIYGRLIAFDRERPRGIQQTTMATLERVDAKGTILGAYGACRSAVLNGLLTKCALEAERTFKLAVSVRGRNKSWPVDAWVKQSYGLRDYLREPMIRGSVPRGFVRRVSKLSRRTDEDRVLHPSFFRDVFASANAWQVLSDLARLLNGWFLAASADGSAEQSVSQQLAGN